MTRTAWAGIAATMAVLLTSGCGDGQARYEGYSGATGGDCAAARTLAGRYRCEATALLGGPAAGASDSPAYRAAQSRMFAAEALDTGRLTEAEATAVVAQAEAQPASARPGR